MRTRQKYRMRTPSTGREVIIEAEPDRIYVDRETGEDLEVVGELLPLAPTARAPARVARAAAPPPRAERPPAAAAELRPEAVEAPPRLRAAPRLARRSASRTRAPAKS